MLTNLFQAVIDGLSALADAAGRLPDSPFSNIHAVAVDNDVLATIAWIIPFDAIIALLTTWGAGIILWYLAKLPLRWIKIAE